MAEGVLLHAESIAKPDQLAASRFLTRRPVRVHRGGRAAAVAVGDFEVGRAPRSPGATRSGATRTSASRALRERARPTRHRARAGAARDAARRARLGGRARLVPARDGRAPARAPASACASTTSVRGRRRTKDAHAIGAIREVTLLVEESMRLIRRRLAACSVDPTARCATPAACSPPSGCTPRCARSGPRTGSRASCRSSQAARAQRIPTTSAPARSRPARRSSATCSRAALARATTAT